MRDNEDVGFVALMFGTAVGLWSSYRHEFTASEIKQLESSQFIAAVDESASKCLLLPTASV